jgi:quercetin dioxygenase-like cupin family protein
MTAPHGFHPEEPRSDAHEQAALYAAGALSETERERFEERVSRGDAEFVEALRVVAPAMEALAASCPPIEPGQRARSAIEARLGIEPRAAGASHHHEHAAEEQEGLFVLRYGNVRWWPTGLPGVKEHTLLADKKNNRRTTLLKMAPGSYIPDHDHAGIEEVLMIEGDLAIGDEKLGPRDYFRITPGARHGEPRTTNGCICLVFSSYSAITTRTKVGFAMRVLRDLFRRGRKSA